MSDAAERRIARAHRFREWCEGEDGLWMVFDAIERDYLEAIRDSEQCETEFREEAYLRLRVLKDIRQVMTAVIVDGASAEKMREATAKRLESIRHGGRSAHH